MINENLKPLSEKLMGSNIVKSQNVLLSHNLPQKSIYCVITLQDIQNKQKSTVKKIISVVVLWDDVRWGWIRLGRSRREVSGGMNNVLYLGKGLSYITVLVKSY